MTCVVRFVPHEQMLRWWIFCSSHRPGERLMRADAWWNTTGISHVKVWIAMIIQSPKWTTETRTCRWVAYWNLLKAIEIYWTWTRHYNIGLIPSGKHLRGTLALGPWPRTWFSKLSSKGGSRHPKNQQKIIKSNDASYVLPPKIIFTGNLWSVARFPWTIKLDVRSCLLEWQMRPRYGHLGEDMNFVVNFHEHFWRHDLWNGYTKLTKKGRCSMIFWRRFWM